MKRDREQGFTIVETMLFLGITGLMVVGILAGAGGSINIQRYHDSVTSLQSFLQQQYSDVTNVANSRSSSWTCDAAGVVPAAATGPARGQSDCVILGRLITNVGNNKLQVSNIIGFIPTPDTTSGLDDTEIFKAIVDLGPPIEYGLGTNISTIDQQTYEIEWQTTLADINGADFNFSIMILRSPVSGLIRTYVDVDDTVSTSADIQDKLINIVAASNTELKLCVSPTGLFAGKPMAVQINAGASGPNGIEMLGDGSSGCNY